MFSRESFLITGHKNPDADCSAAIIAFSLILSKLSKKTTAVIGKEHKKKFSYLLDLCRGLPIQIVDAPEDVGENYDTVVVLDTPKPSMLEFGDEIRALMNREDIVVMEIDHHTESDGTFMGDEGYRLVDAVASTCGLIGQLALRLSRKHIDGIFSQNFLMAIVTGIISDTQMGKFIRVRREKRHFKYFKKRLNQSLSKNTAGEHKNTSNISTALDIAQELEALTEEEEACFECFSRHKQTTGMISWIAFDEQKSNTLQEQFSMKTITEVARHTASILAEESGFLSLVAYYDDKAESDLIQLRMRRSHTYRELDLRTVLEHFKFENGGGHEGAVGFRLPRTQVADFSAFIERIVLGVIELAGQK